MWENTTMSVYKFNGYAHVLGYASELFNLETQAVSLAQATNNIKHQIAAAQLGVKPSGQPFPKVIIESGQVRLVDNEATINGEQQGTDINCDANKPEQLTLEFG